ncbi:MAG TPA: tetratricopeptide repeat protein [Terriglobales bacterium]|nr:tetratricopeptide repeat protein [Terriglobales bacterium]
MQGSDQRDAAVQFFRQGYALQMKGEYERAIELYTRSIEAYPTAEAYTFRGWSYSFLGDYDTAISECKQAIRVDPDFGNPYNDIGAYLIEQGKLAESLDWLEKATRAPRYDSYCYPWFNMGRIYERMHRWDKAAECYEKALAENPDYQVAKVALRKLKIMWN